MKVLVVGCERSGTTVISNLLGKATGKSILDDPMDSWYLYPAIYMQFTHISFKLWWQLQNHYIVKVPGFATILPYLRKYNIAKFRVIYVIRDPRDGVAAMLEKLKVDLNGLYLNVHWLGCRPTSIIEALAWRWRLYLENAIAFSENHPTQIRFIKYEDFIDNKMQTVQELASELGLPFDGDAILPEINKQFRKDWSSTIAGKQRYKQDLNDSEIQVILSICSDLMTKFNYTNEE